MTQQFDRFLELDDAGWSGRQIAKDLGVAERTVCRWRALTGRAKQEAPATHPASDRARAAEMIADGAPIQEAAAAVGVTYATVRRWFPDAQAWTKSQAGQYGQMSRRLSALGRVA
jgi:transposase